MVLLKQTNRPQRLRIARTLSRACELARGKVVLFAGGDRIGLVSFSGGITGMRMRLWPTLASSSYHLGGSLTRDSGDASMSACRLPEGERLTHKLLKP